jgi:hypothetical protein
MSEDELAIQDAARTFAQERIAPLVSKMDKEAKLDAGLLKEMFEQGVRTESGKQRFRRLLRCVRAWQHREMIATSARVVMPPSLSLSPLSLSLSPLSSLSPLLTH